MVQNAVTQDFREEEETPGWRRPECWDTWTSPGRTSSPRAWAGGPRALSIQSPASREGKSTHTLGDLSLSCCLLDRVLHVQPDSGFFINEADLLRP